MIIARPALLQALKEAPGYGRELVRRPSTSAGRLSSPKAPSTRPFVSWRPHGSCGAGTSCPAAGAERARTYYELTERGVRVSEANRADLLRLAAPESSRLPILRLQRMRERIELGAELSETAGHSRCGFRGPAGSSRTMGKPTRFLRVALKVAEALGTEGCLLAGGLAVMAHVSCAVPATWTCSTVSSCRRPRAPRGERPADPSPQGRPPRGRLSRLKGE